VKQANARFAAAVSSSRAEFREGTVEKLVCDAGSFGKVCTTNTIHFWPSLDGGFAEIRPVLSPGGRLVVGFLPKEWMDRMGFPCDLFTTCAPDDVIAALARTGFSDV
jgi:arsenite methyltransferase